jgi:hypothetical protein
VNTGQQVINEEMKTRTHNMEGLVSQSSLATLIVTLASLSFSGIQKKIHPLNTNQKQKKKKPPTVGKRV